MDASRREIIEQLDAQRRSQNASLLRIYNYYRVLVGISLLVIFVREIGDRLIGTLDPDAFVITVSLYIAVNLVIAIGSLALPDRFVGRATPAFALVALDVIALTVLMLFSDGVTSGLGTLIIVSVAAGSILVTGRIATLLPAIATIAVLYEEFYRTLLPAAQPADWFQAGLLGALYFATSLFIQDVSRRLRRSEITSLERAAEVASLERLNRLIVQRMHTGIVVLARDGNLRLINDSARRLLGAGDRELADIELPDVVHEHLAKWRHNHYYRPAPFRADPAGPELRVTFSTVSDSPHTEIMIFLEDNSELAQQAQQMKLAALGRLSASIAHEIRNPLGAIAHAGQLLKESPNLDSGDQRLTEIIAVQSRRMNDVIENVLELSRRRAAEPQALPMQEWVSSFVEQFREGLDAPAEIETDMERPEAEMLMDPGQLTQVLTNLVSNGLRFSEKATGRRWVRLEGGVQAVTGRPFLQILDAGPGVDPEQVQHLFEPFYTTEETGTGLGLFISRELCEGNQARLSYQPRAEGGSCFRISFAPLEPRALEPETSGDHGDDG